MPDATIKPERKKGWPPSFLPVLGAITGVSLFLLTLINIFYLTKYADLITHVGLFQAQRHPEVLLALFILLFILYLFFYWFVITSCIYKKRIKQIIIFSGVFIAILLISGPFMSADLYSYIFRAEMANTLQINPYQVTPAEAGYGKVTPWNSLTMPYGPIFSILIMGLQKIAGSSMEVNLFIFRLFNSIIFFVCGYLIFKILIKTKPEFAYKGAALFLWNPFILIEIVNNGHNDILMLLFILLSIYFIVHQKYGLSALMIIGGFLSKYVIIILLPIPLIMLLMNNKFSLRKRIKKLALAVVIIVCVLVIFYLPFGTFGKTLSNVETSFFESQKLTLPRMAILGITQGVAKVFNYNPEPLAKILYATAFVMIYAWLLLYFKMYKNDNFIKQYFWIIFALLALLTFNTDGIWYYIWIMPLVLLVRNKRYYPLIIFFTGLGFLFYLYGFSTANIVFFIPLIIFYFTFYIFNKLNIRLS
jgi:hypothetical protein